MNRFLNARIVSILLVLLIACLVVPVAFSQETTAGIQGTVKDPTGAVVAKATVEVTSPALIGSQKATTDSAGNFRITTLPVGTYTLTVNAPGFRAFRQNNIDLSVGRLPLIDIQLAIGGTSEIVEVTEEAPIVDVTQSKVAVNVEHQILDNLPKGRGFQSLIPFAAGARNEPLQATRGNTSGGFQIDGAGDSENVYMIDGVNVSNIQRGGVGNGFITDFVQEVNIKSSSFEAEYGAAIGGVVNAVPKHGSNAWHGQLLTYFRSNTLDANDPCLTFTFCGLRNNPATSLNTAARLDATPQYYVPKKDGKHTVEPGFSVGGPVIKDRLWLFASYIPTLETTNRTTTFNKLNPGPRTLQNTFTQHNAYSRLDYRLSNSLRLFASWTYAFSRTKGQLGGQDSAYGQINTGAGTDPNSLRSDDGTVNPSSVHTFGADWTPSSKLVVSGRFGYTFTNSGDRGKPVGIRYVYNTTLNNKALGLDGNVLDQTNANTAGFFNIPSNKASLHDAFKRHQFNVDASYFVGNFWGSHSFKFGYLLQRQSNDVFQGFNTALVTVNWSDVYTPVTDVTACDKIIQDNVAKYGGTFNRGNCRGFAGYFTVQDGVETNGTAAANTHGLYLQDGWNVGHGLSLNLGVRFEKELVPPFKPGFPSIQFGFTDKIAPRLGFAYDLLHNGKVKLYGSYGQFFDVVKFGLPRGSFGGDYWHNCVYALDDTNFKGILPSSPGGHGCGPSGPAGGVTVGRFIENVDFRKNNDDPTDPGIDPRIKPMENREYVGGVDWAITPVWGLETRYARKRLVRTIEDFAANDNLGFFIGNPGPGVYSDLLHRANSGLPALCPSCPSQPKPSRDYDGVEFRLTRRAGQKWFGSISYTYSRLYGNYPGLTSTDVTDGTGGRHDPSNNRSFDLPTMQFDAHGKFADGLLATDRPHTAKVFGYYRLKWFGMETLLGVNQFAYAGSILNTCMSLLGSTSSCMYPEGRGKWIRFTRDPASGNLVAGGIVKDARTPPFYQTDFNFQHTIKPSKAHENYALTFEANIINALNNHSVVATDERLFATGILSPTRAKQFPGDPGFDYLRATTGFDYTAEINAERKTLRGTYGLPEVFQFARNMRLAVRFTF